MKLILVQPQLRFGADADNLRTIRTQLETERIAFSEDDIVLLPEGVLGGAAGDRYTLDLGSLARALGCHVVGGSHREAVLGGSVNAGCVFAPDGSVVGRYEKRRPYASERQNVQPGEARGEFVIGGRAVLVMICSDFWFADLLQRATRLPDLVLVAALSVTRKPTPEYSRTLWRHLAVARAYEFGVYVGISDWGYPSELPGTFPCGVGGFADPTTVAPDKLFTSIGTAGVAVHPIDFAALEDFRRDRVARGFFWRALG